MVAPVPQGQVAREVGLAAKETYGDYWDFYVGSEFPALVQRDAAGKEVFKWPGDEWGHEKMWRTSFDALFTAHVPPTAKLFAEIERRVADFWSSIRANDPPPPDFARDGTVLAEVLGEPTEEVADLRADNRADELAREFLDARAARDEAELRMDAAKCELMLKIGDAGRALLGLHRITCGMTKGSPDREITEADVGQIIKGRKGYRQFLVKESN